VLQDLVFVFCILTPPPPPPPHHSFRFVPFGDHTTFKAVNDLLPKDEKATWTDKAMWTVKDPVPASLMPWVPRYVAGVRVFLATTASNRKQATDLGAVWNEPARKWVAPENADLSRFVAFFPLPLAVVHPDSPFTQFTPHYEAARAAAARAAHDAAGGSGGGGGGGAAGGGT